MPAIESREHLHPDSRENQDIILEHIGAKAKKFMEEATEAERVAAAVKEISSASVQELAPHLKGLAELAERMKDIDKFLEEEAGTIH